MRSYQIPIVKPHTLVYRNTQEITLKKMAALFTCLLAGAMLISLFQSPEKPSSDGKRSDTPHQEHANKSSTAWSNSPFAQTKPQSNKLAPARWTAESGIIPMGLTDQEWRDLKVHLDHPANAPIAKRDLLYTAYRHDIWQLKELISSGNARNAQAIELAKDIQAGLSTWVLKNRMSGSEAMLTIAMVLEVTESDPVQRKASIHDFERNLTASMITAPDRPNPEYFKQKQNLQAAWEAQPVASRDIDHYWSQLKGLSGAYSSEISPNT